MRRREGSPATATVATWNVEWASPGGPRGRAVAAHLASLGADVLCVTEGAAALLPPDGHVVEAEPDYGYAVREGRRKVLLWSRSPWREVDRVGHPGLPPGRFAAGLTETPLGELHVIGVCIPWSMAHVAGGRRDRSRWEDHLAFLAGLDELLGGLPASAPVVIAGDFNQRVPRHGGRPPRQVAAALAAALTRTAIVTAGVVPGLETPLIDHVALGEGLRARRVRGWSADPEGRRLSDHTGVMVEIAAE